MNDFQALLATHDGIALAHLVRGKEVSPAELLEAALANVDAVNPALNAVAERLDASARTAAASVTGLESALAGVPTLVKDLFMPVRGARMANGSHLFGDYRPDFDGELVARLRRAGIPIFGTSLSPEFGTSYCTSSARFGITHNPWHPDVTCGGSSGAAAALVAARAIPFAHGNDGGGSLRVPASCCGVFGLKPSRGRTPMGPMAGEGWAGMGINHAITRTVRDSAALLDLISGADIGAPYAAPAQSETFLSATHRDPRSLRIAVIDRAPPWPTDPACRTALAHTVSLLSSLGHHVEPIASPVDSEAFYDHVFTIIGAQTRAMFDTIASQRGFPVDGNEVEARTRIIVREKGGVSGAQYAAAVDWIHALGRTFGRLMERYDLLLMPTLATPPLSPAKLAIGDDTLLLSDVIERSHRFSPFTAWFNATGQPAMSVPLFWDEHGLPIGSQFAGAFGSESLLFSLAAQLERAAPWAARVPPVHAGSIAS
ncbi:amidase [Trinickia caryophylli]|uniref:Amidase n=1 Tax=Trinickia caryophylli TaxID=28094 RepID=A0A1X7CIR7_TRICW|nr:amidase [Trinickia caryophylli]PMS11511.1 amidase [Trinickia caryophylli]TRX19937.1 amidase [Trinickia caryophylli]WQE12726.1 amidase [Trinickia caryophylli]SME97395.1 amidase [Trinickia caryophylli]GLU30433.1 6-aminohexanoate-cyclic-dimer hydrolase [Trinickia caryophylli]